MQVVYRTIPTSNHNLFSTIGVAVFVVYRTIPTSNHNAPLQRESQPLVVYRTIPTSNHNCRPSRPLCLLLYIVLFLHQTTTSLSSIRKWSELYIVLFLHQTTTLRGEAYLEQGCISYYSYIKPQPGMLLPISCTVVYRTIPTSNHNYTCVLDALFLLYIVLFLHQTTTTRRWEHTNATLYIVLFLHQTTTLVLVDDSPDGCISYYSYIKPQHLKR